MKKIFTLCLLAVTMCAVAQNKKIALLEPRPGEGTTVSGMEKAMVRGELRKAIVNHTGYEAFTRSDIDQLMNEQGFQRTGNVSEEDIHKLGEMSGADYICVSTLNKSNTEFYLEAYLIDIESGAISNPASQFGELIDGKLSNMLPVCQALAQELLGTANPVVSLPSHNSVKSTQTSTPAPAPSTTGKEVVTTSANVFPVVTNESNLQDVVTFADGSMGVVFYREGEHGLVVSLDEISTQWQREDTYMYDLRGLPNGQMRFVVGMGLTNTRTIISELGEHNALAAKWCVQHGEGWYLPSVGEMQYLMNVARSGKEVMGPVNLLIVQAGGKPLLSKYYWTSNEEDDDGAYNVSRSGEATDEDKDEKVAVRAIRQF